MEEEEEDDVSKCAEPILIRLNCLSVLSICNRVRSIFERIRHVVHTRPWTTAGGMFAIEIR